MTMDCSTAPALSVIMANHNGAAFLKSAIDSVLSQSLQDLELIVSDDCSTDESLDILSKVADERLRVITAQTNAGPAIARNRAIDVARGSWIAVVDSDDLMHPDRFRYLLDAAREHNATLIADNQLFFDANSDLSRERLFPLFSKTICVDTAALLAEDFAGVPNRLGYLKPLIRRDALADLRYAPGLRIGEDLDLLLRLTLAGQSLTILPEAYYYYRRHSASLSHRLTSKEVSAMIAGLQDLNVHEPHHREAITARINALQKRESLEAVVQDIKERRIVRATTAIVQTPSVMLGLGQIARAKLWDKGKAREGSAVLPVKLSTKPVSKGVKVHVRVPTYKRPDQLQRALQGLQNQTEQNWICDVYDDDPSRSSEDVVTGLGDARIHYHANVQNLMASKNIDQCFTKTNPHGANYFCVLEDDNQFLPTHLEDNIRVIERKGVEVVLRNQLVEYGSGTEKARLSKAGLLETKFVEGCYDAAQFHLALIADMGVSNGGLFWSSKAISNLEIGVSVSATLQEYLRTLAIVEPVYVAMEPTAVWAENGTNTTRDLGSAAGWFARELALKRSVQILQRRVWAVADKAVQSDFVRGALFNYPDAMRASGLVKSHNRFFVGQALSPRETLRLALRGAFIRFAGRPEPGLSKFLERLKTSVA